MKISEEYREMNKGAGWTITWIVIAATVLGTLGTGSLYFFGPWRESIRREIFEESRAHVVGSNQNLGRLLREYEAAEPGHQASLRELILMEADTLPEDNLNAGVRARINQLRGY